MKEASSPPKGRRFSLWALGFGVAALVVAAFVPVVHAGPTAMRLPPLKLAAIALAVVAAVFAAIAHGRQEDRRLYVAALAFAGAGAFLEYVIVIAILLGAASAFT